MWVRGLSECAVTKIIPGWLYQPSAPDRTGPSVALSAWAEERPANREADSAVAVAVAKKVLRRKMVPPEKSADCEREYEDRTEGLCQVENLRSSPLVRGYAGQVIGNCSNVL
jgi:hypothetical protein